MLLLAVKIIISIQFPEDFVFLYTKMGFDQNFPLICKLF